MSNERFAEAFDELATLLELGGESAFKTRAFRTFSQTARSLEEPIEAIAARNALESIPGVGKGIAAAIAELLATGTLVALDQARGSVPATLPELLRVSGLGPGRIRRLWKEANVTSLRELVEGCRDGRVAKTSGFGDKLAAKLLTAAEAALRAEGSVLLAQAQELSRQVAHALSEAGARQSRTAGAVRRGHEIVDELTMVVEGLGAAEVARALADPSLGRYAVRLTDDGGVIAEPKAPAAGPQLRAVCASHKEFVGALLRATGSDAHLSALEARAKKQGTTLAKVCAQAQDEAEIYAALGLGLIPPELREDGSLLVPEGLLGARGVRGVFHVHTNWSDGTASVVAMAKAAAEAGYAYVGISDHSRAASYANGLDEARLLAQSAEIEKARREVPQITILHGIEVDVLDDGALDLSDESLARLDFVVASIHSRFSLDSATQTARIIKAISHPLVTMLGHPTGRLLLGRQGYTYDFDAVAEAAAAYGVALEINASPQRLDLGPDLIRRAAAKGARFCINPDAHEPQGFGDVPLGVAQARRAGLSADRVLNALDTEAVSAALAARRAEAAKLLASQHALA